MTLSCIVPWRAGDPEREQNLHACLAGVLAQGLDEVVLVELAPVPSGINVSAGVQVLFVADPTDFNRGRAINEGLHCVDGERVLILDADVLLWENWLHDSRGALEVTPALLPFDRVHYLRPSYSDQLRQQAAPIGRPGLLHQRAERVSTTAKGGALWVHRETFWQVGGFDEEYVGWGGEDDDFHMRLECVQHVPRLVGWPLLHLWHPKGDRSTSSANRDRFRAKRRALQS